MIRPSNTNMEIINKNIKTCKKLSFDDAKQAMQSQWQALIASYGVAIPDRPNKKINCPLPKHEDHNASFRFTDKSGGGDWVCTCINGDGFALINQISGYPAKHGHALQQVRSWLGDNYFIPDQQVRSPKPITLAPDAEEIKRHDAAAAKAEAIFAVAKPALTAYLNDTKQYADQVTGLTAAGAMHNRRLAPNTLIIPMINADGEVRNIEAIPALAKGQDKHSKYGLAGGQKSGLYHRLDGSSKTVGISEGYSKSLAINLAYGCTTYTAFSAGNMPAVARIARTQHPEAKIILFGDNGNGSDEAINAAIECSGYISFPDQQFKDWDDVRLAGLDVAAMIERNTQHPTIVDLSTDDYQCFGVDVGHDIFSDGVPVGSFGAVLQQSRYPKISLDPTPTNSLVLNAGYAYCFNTKTRYIPIISALHDADIFEACRKKKGTRQRLSWANKADSKQEKNKRLYALLNLAKARIGLDIVPDTIKKWFGHDDRLMLLARVFYFAQKKIAAGLFGLDGFKSERVTLKKAVNGKHNDLDFSSLIEAKEKYIFLATPHGTGKTRHYIKPMVERSISAVIVCHRIGLTNDIANVLNCNHYTDDYGIVSQYTVDKLVTCIDSLAADRIAKHSPELFVIDEAAQVLRHLMAIKEKEKRQHIIEALKKMASNAKQVIFADADLCTFAAKQWLELLDDNEAQPSNIITGTAHIPDQQEKPFSADLIFSMSPRHWASGTIKQIIADLKNGHKPIVFCSAPKTARIIEAEVKKHAPSKSTLLIAGEDSLDDVERLERKHFFADVDGYVKTNAVDLLIHTSAMGSGVSLQSGHFDKGYALITPEPLLPTDVIQGIRRCRTLKHWKIVCLLPTNGRMASFWKDSGADAAEKHGLGIDKQKRAIGHRSRQIKSVYGFALINRLQHFGFGLGQLDDLDAEILEGITTSKDIANIDAVGLLQGIDQRHVDARTNAAEFYGISQDKLTFDHAQAYCTTSKVTSLRKMLSIQSNQYAPIWLNSFTKQTTSLISTETIPNHIEEIKANAGLWFAVGLLPEKWSRAIKVGGKQPVGWFKDWLQWLGFEVKVKKTDNIARGIVVAIPEIMHHKLNIKPQQDPNDLLIRMVVGGSSVANAAKAVGISRATAYRIIKLSKE